MAVWSVRIAAVLCIWAAVASLVAGNNFPQEDSGNTVYWDFPQEETGITPLLGRPDRWHLVPKIDHVIPPYSSVARLFFPAVDDDPNSGCTGTFITHNVILTCAHCFFVPGTDRRYAEGWVSPGAYKWELFPLSNYKYTAAKGIMYPGYINPLVSALQIDVALIILDEQVSRSANGGIRSERETEFKPTQLEVTKTDDNMYLDPIMWSYPGAGSDVQSDETVLTAIENNVMHVSDGGIEQTYLYVQFVKGGIANRARWAQTNLNSMGGCSGAGIMIIAGDSSEDVDDESYVMKAILTGDTDGYNRALPFDCELMNWIWEQILANGLSRVPDVHFEETVPCHEEDADGCVTWIGQCDPPEDPPADDNLPGGDDDSA